MTRPRRRPTLIDPRLAARVSITRRYLVVAGALGIAATVALVVQAVLIANIIDRSLLHGATIGAVTPQLVGLAGAFVARAACASAAELAAARTSLAVTSTLRRALLRQTLDLGPVWLSGERAGELSATATRGIAALDVYFGRYLPQAVLAVLAPVGILVWVGWEDPVSLLILLGLLALVPPTMIHFGRAAAEQTARQWRSLGSLSSRTLELIQGLPTLRAFGRSDQGRREIEGASESLRAATMRTLRVAFLSALSMEFLAGMGTGLVAMVLGFRLLNGTVGLSTALAVLLVSPEVFIPLRRAAAEFHASAEGQAAAERILDVLAEPVAPRADATTRTAVPPPARAAAGTAVSVRGLSVSYPERGAALNDLSFEVGPGEHVAVVGPSGADKSTLLSVLLGFVEPTAGEVLLDGASLAAVPVAEWRAAISWVPQRPHLFGGSVADNVRLGAPKATHSQVSAALELAGLGHWLGGLPEGISTQLGEEGLSLSSGELQRLALARVVVRDSPLVLLDEPASHLDAATEAEVAYSLEAWLSRRTVVVTAHRSELVARIDRIVELSAPRSEAVALGARPPS